MEKMVGKKRTVHEKKKNVLIKKKSLCMVSIQ